MLIACWSVKGGSGTTVAAASLAVLLARRRETDVVVADLGGDLPGALGLPDAGGPGLAGWLSAGPDVAADALVRLEVDAGPHLRLLPWGDDAGSPVRSATVADGERLALSLAGRRPVVVDCGPPGTAAGAAVASTATVSLLVLRPCFLALRRAVAAPFRPSGVLLVEEPGRALHRGDVEDVLGVPVAATIPWDPAVARAVDAGLLAKRVPRTLARALREAA